MNDCELIIGISGMACAIIKSCSDDEISLLSSVLTQLGDTLATYLTQKQICSNRVNNQDNGKSADSMKSNNDNKNDNKTDNSNDESKGSNDDSKTSDKFSM